ncbi:sugar ABC transporter ATP-binding protein [Paenibacillus eucommiae]|uniref:ABC-type sugar transport system ATPase subunit n=1 Tax=Paenibacillus eucommiae TaxID=1355755 RepID=A0ABS4IX24_9BACL|nr:sugar ABC transporter ATP-binding protein [Paenibacillus eucommiae]MBP1992133.1 ABC-type sugar transport system ATPase subunit [Paenibacillus eucommiae]
MNEQNQGSTLLKLSGINKRFGANQILHSVDFTLEAGQVHALMGANGAGKSTLMKIIAGEYTLDSGRIELEGKEIEIHNPAQAKRHGISVIHQELNLVPEMTIADNVFLGKEAAIGKSNFLLSRVKALTLTKQLLDRFGIGLDPSQKIKHLSLGHQQLVEILKALSDDSKVLVMDEPTATLTSGETERLFAVIRSLRSKGIGIVYISHRLDEIQEICDHVTILKDGKMTAEGPIGEFNNDTIIERMVGRNLGNYYPESTRQFGNPLLELRQVQKQGALQDVSLTLRAGEIVGIFGLLGAGQSDLMRVIFGAERPDSGQIRIEDREVRIGSPAAAKQLGIALVTENRKEEGLVLEMGSDQNMVLASMKQFSRYGVKAADRIQKTASAHVEKLGIKLPSLKDPVKQLSGGNQQKVILGKWLITSPQVILLSEPTRGVDVGARSEIYHILSGLADEGKGIIVASSDVDEVLGMSDRILVMFQGKIVAELEKRQASEDLLMEFASGAAVQTR